MKNIAVIGAFFGDEGKARIVNYLAKDYKYVVRFGGGSNAGHTLYQNNAKIVRHVLPSADFTLNQFAVLASGMVINPQELLKEVEESEKIFSKCASKIIVDPDAFVVTAEHLEEDKQNIKNFGSTGKGISVAYRDKIYRKGTKIKDILNSDESLLKLKKMGVQFKYNLELFNEFKNNPIIFEGAQAVMLDINSGTYPFVTSGDCGLGGIFNSGFSYAMPSKVYGVVKAYSTRVGEGPFPTEIIGDEAEKIRSIGGEYGSTTGRARRIGWLDLPALKYACVKGGLTDLILTKVDVLNSFDRIKICSSYNKEVFSGSDFFDATPVYSEIIGWGNAKQVKNIEHFLNIIEMHSGCKVKYVSNGVNPEDMLIF